MRSKGQIGYEAYCDCIQWLQPKVVSWSKLGAAAKDAWEAAAEAIAVGLEQEYESRIEDLKEQLTRVKNGGEI